MATILWEHKLSLKSSGKILYLEIVIMITFLLDFRIAMSLLFYPFILEDSIVAAMPFHHYCMLGVCGTDDGFFGVSYFFVHRYS